MSKHGSSRRVPSTPKGNQIPSGQAGAAEGPDTADARRSQHAAPPADSTGDSAKQAPTPKTPEPRREPTYLTKGAGCRPDLHRRGSELDSGRLGQVPTRRTSRIGVGLVVWCLLGTLFIDSGRWTPFAIQICVLWLAFSAVVQRRAGHRGRCWRTRAWRHAWGGLVPSSDVDPTRPAGT